MIYTPDNCPRGTKVFVNGVEVDHACMADTDRGVAEFIPWPPKIKRPERDQVYKRTLRGNVTVELPA